MDSEGFTLSTSSSKKKGKSSLDSKRATTLQKQKQRAETSKSTLFSTQVKEVIMEDVPAGEEEEGIIDSSEFSREPMFSGPIPAKITDVAMDEDDDELMIDPSLPTPVTRIPPSEQNQLSFPPLNKDSLGGGGITLTQHRKLTIPPHRMTPLKKEWDKIYRPLVEELGLKVRVIPSKRGIELKTSKHTKAPTSLQRAVDFLAAFFLGFTPDDALALLRMEELYIDSFEIKDVKQVLQADHLSRAIGRIAGKDGKTRFAIENATRTRIVLADSKIHILGTFQSIKMARDAVCALILGSAPGKVYANLRNVAARSKERS